MDSPHSALDSLDLPSSDTHADSVWASACLSALLDRHGISSRHQATEIAHICSISISQARRKLRGAVWLFDEVQAICRHFGESLDTVLGHKGGARLATEPGMSASAGVAGATTSYPATLLIDGQEMACDIQLGPLCNASNGQSCQGLVAYHCQQGGWRVSTVQRCLQSDWQGAHYAVSQLQLRNHLEQTRARIAVLDDDAGSADALTDWFNEVGYEAHAYTSADALLAQPLTQHDAFVVDLILGGGQTSQAIVERIRQAQPEAPIVLLTGQLRDGTASEATLATILRTQGVTFFEKPVRPAVLTAAIQSSLDRQPPSPPAIHG